MSRRSTCRRRRSGSSDYFSESVKATARSLSTLREVFSVYAHTTPGIRDSRCRVRCRSVARGYVPPACVATVSSGATFVPGFSVAQPGCKPPRTIPGKDADLPKQVIPKQGAGPTPSPFVPAFPSCHQNSKPIAPAVDISKVPQPKRGSTAHRVAAEQTMVSPGRRLSRAIPPW